MQKHPEDKQIQHPPKQEHPPSNSQQQVQQKTEVNNQEQAKKDIVAKMKIVKIIMEEKSKKNGDRKKIKFYQDLINKHEYWDTRPTLREDKEQNIFGNIEGERKVEEVEKDPFKLPLKELFWCEIDVNDEKELEEFYQLLTNNYVEDQDNTFRFDYSREFLHWALTPPGYQPKWLVGIRNEHKQLIASITGVPVTALIEKDQLKMAEINFLCVHKKYRVNKLTPLLISEVTRRVNLKNKWQAIYTSGKTLPTPFTRATYYHRSLNPKKLIDIRFSALGPNQTYAMVAKLYSVPEELTIEGLRPMSHKKDVEGVMQLVNEGLSKLIVKFHFTAEEVKHYFMPRDKIVYTYVVEKNQIVGGKKKTKITDVLSFYNLPSHVMNNDKHNMLHACYSYYNFATTVPLTELIRNALILAKRQKFDVYNCLNLMDNASFFEDLHFQVGDGNLNYYLYNWIMHCKKIEPKDLGVVLF